MSLPSVRLVLTGAPGSGKTAIMHRLASDPAFRWLAFLPELARELLAADPTYRTRWDEFHRELYTRQCRREDQLEERPFVTDRGTVDAFGFHPQTLETVGSSLLQEYRRYTHVLFLETSAHLGSSYYQTDQIRQESSADALARESALLNAWGGHVGLTVIAATDNFETKYQQVAHLLMNVHTAESVSLNSERLASGVGIS